MKNLFTPHDAAMLPIDQQRGTLRLAVSTPYDEVVRDTRALARTAVETKMTDGASPVGSAIQGVIYQEMLKRLAEGPFAAAA